GDQLRPGELVITEVMIDGTDCGVNDRMAYIEVLNTSANALALELLRVRVDGADELVDYIGNDDPVDPGEYAVLWRKATAGPCYAAPDREYEYPRLVLGAKLIELVAQPLGGQAVVVDAVDFRSGFTIPAGASLALDPVVVPSSAANDGASAWCVSGTRIPGASFDRGSPGSANDCDAATSDTGDGGNDTSSCAPRDPSDGLTFEELRPGDLMIVEAMTSPLVGSETRADYLEVVNTTPYTIFPAGLTLSIGGSASTIELEGSAASMAPGGRALMRRKSSFPSYYAASYQFRWNPGTDLSATNLVIANTCTTVDQVDLGSFGSIVAGASIQLDPDVPLLREDSNDSAVDWCVGVSPIGSTVDFGTPNEANVCTLGGGPGPGPGGPGGGPGGGSDSGDCRALQDPSDGLQADELCDGDLVMTEFLIDRGNPAICTSTTKIQYLEVFNTTNYPVEPDGLLLRVGTFTPKALTPRSGTAGVIAPRSRAVIARKQLSGWCGSLLPDFTYDSIELVAGAIQLEAGVEVVDAINVASWFIPSGAALGVRPEVALAGSLDNDFESSWCEAGDVLAGTIGRGSPGGANTCRFDGGGSGGDSGDTDQTPAVPGSLLAAGDLIVVEVMEDPNCDGGAAEFFEILNRTDVPVDLSGISFTVIDGTGRTYTQAAPAGVIVASGEVAVVGRKDSPQCFQADLTFTTMRLDDTRGNTIEVWNEGNPSGRLLVDRLNTNPASFVPATARAEGFSLQFGVNYDAYAVSNDSPAFWCKAEDISGNAYTDIHGTDHATPGQANGPCLAIDDDTASDTGFGGAGGPGGGGIGDDTFTIVVADKTLDELDPGSLVITEVLVSPLGCGEQAEGEYFEVYNATAFSIDLFGLQVIDEDSFSEVQQSRVIRPGRYVVLQNVSAGFDRCLDFGPRSPTYFNDPFDDEGDEVVIRDPAGRILDRAPLYGLPRVVGSAWQLNPAVGMTSTANDDIASWCLADATIAGGTGNRGTPKTANVCRVEAPPPDPTDPAVYVDELRAGDLLITEIQVNPSVCTDDRGEFFEVFNTLGSPVNLRGLRIQNAAGSAASYTIPTDIVIPPRQLVVFGRPGVVGCYGFTPGVTYNGALFNNAGDLVELRAGTNYNLVIDRVDFRGWNTYLGRTLSLDPGPSRYNTVANNLPGNWCAGEAFLEPSGRDRGTPRAGNPTCYQFLPPTPVDTDSPVPPDTDDTPIVIVGPDTGLPVDSGPWDTNVPPTPSSSLNPGDLVITEVMANPLECGRIATGAEYVEVYNNTDAPVDLQGLTLASSFYSYTFPSSVVIGPRRLAVGRHATSSPCHGFTPDFTWTSVVFSDLNEVVTLRVGSTVIDSVDLAFANGSGGWAWNLSTHAHDAAANDTATSWCPSIPLIPGASVDRGTPGTVNTRCAETATGPFDTPLTGETGDTDSGNFADVPVGVPLSTLQTGDLILTELHVDPRDCTDVTGEYVEIYNRTGQLVNLDGLVLRSVSTSYTFDRPDGRFEIGAGEHLVLRRSARTPCYDLPDAETYGSVVLGGSEWLVAITSATRVFDAVNLTGWEIPPGRAMMLDPLKYGEAVPPGFNDFPDLIPYIRTYVHDDPNDWCPAYFKIPGASGDRGNPGVVSPPCLADGAPVPYPPGYIADIAELDGGELVITELMVAGRDCPDPGGEWIEITNVASIPIALDGLRLSANGAEVLIETSAVIFPGDTFVGAKSTIATCQPRIDVDFTYNLVSFPNAGDVVQLRNAHSVIDAFDYRGRTVYGGRALSLDPGAWTATANDDLTQWCDASETIPGARNDKGTPGSVNFTCAGGSGSLDVRAIEEVSPGDLVVTEMGVGACGSADQFIEVYNASSAAIDLRRLRITSGLDRGLVADITTSAIVEPQGYAILRSSGTYRCMSINEDARWTFGVSFPFPGEIRLRAGTVDIDVITLGTLGPLPVGESLQLVPGVFDATANDDVANWCQAQNVFGDDPSKGTPGEANNCALVVDTGFDTGSLAPTPSSVIRSYSIWEITNYAPGVTLQGDLFRVEGEIPYGQPVENAISGTCAKQWAVQAVPPLLTNPATCVGCAFAFEVSRTGGFDVLPFLFGGTSACSSAFNAVGGTGATLPNVRIAYSPVDQVVLWQSNGQWVPYSYDITSFGPSSLVFERDAVPPVYVY
ncbi:MAG: hypothetical protein RLZZ383_170, partial [Pseudomonadota bacterium]